MKDVPEVITIDGIDVFIKVRSLDSSEGEFSPVAMTITLNKHMNPQYYRRILMHELTHAVMHISARGLTDYVIEMEHEEAVGEIIAEQVGERLYEVFIANPKLRRYLWG